MKSGSERQTDRGREGGFLEGDGEGGWWGVHMDDSFICAGLLRGKWRNRPDFLFSCAVFLMRSQSVCLAKTQKTHIYSVHFSLFLSLSQQFSVLLASFSVSQRLVESYFKPLMLNVFTRYSFGFLQSHQPRSVTLLYPIFLYVTILYHHICSQTNSTIHIVFLIHILNTFYCSAFLTIITVMLLSHCPSQTSCFAFGMVLWHLRQGCTVCMEREWMGGEYTLIWMDGTGPNAMWKTETLC